MIATYSEWEQVKESDFGFKMKQKTQLVPEDSNSIFCVMCNYYIFTNTDFFYIVKNDDIYLVLLSRKYYIMFFIISSVEVTKGAEAT